MALSGVERVELRARFLVLVGQVGVSAAARQLGMNRNTAVVWALQAGVRWESRLGCPGHPGRGEYDRLRVSGVGRGEAARRVGVHVRTAGDWDRGVRRRGNGRDIPDGRGAGVRVASPRPGWEGVTLHPRFLTLAEREQIADLRRDGASLRAIGRVLGRPASTIKREIDNRSVGGVYRPYQAHRAWASGRAREPVMISV